MVGHPQVPKTAFDRQAKHFTIVCDFLFFGLPSKRKETFGFIEKHAY
jgi:hypothetical protein